MKIRMRFDVEIVDEIPDEIVDRIYTPEEAQETLTEILREASSKNAVITFPNLEIEEVK